jgi:hypothetical protein
VTARGILARGLLVAGLGAMVPGCGGDSGGPSQDLDDVSLADVQAQVLSPRCAVPGCHVGAGAPFGLDLSAGASEGNLVMVASAEVPELLRVEPRNAADSYLYMKLSGDPRIQGDPMPASGGPLGAGQLQLIEDWIEQGAK